MGKPAGKANKRARRTRSGALAMTSLMDVLTIILLFLLVNYSDNVSQTDITQDITLPSIQSKPEVDAGEGLVVEVRKEHVLVDGQVFSYHDNKEALSQMFAQKKTQGGVATLRVKGDKDLDFDRLDFVVQSAAQAGLGQIDFIAMARE